ncbi:putative protein phosphatase 2C 9 [Apostasia shenzhenica]|uniref:protein-serine/threonine phosphatase n=1 Tax=Apostasia shenzhenica TaxID=1088818 RepID=A0A2H9ZS46_9ASPA|nr:putative protein phosphatase 2C 9 [Apostasia shenzhenica]
MAEVCLGGVGGEESSESGPCEKPSRAARRRRMEIRRLRCIAGVESMGKPVELDFKRKRSEPSDLPSAVPQKTDSGDRKKAENGLRKPDPVGSIGSTGSGRYLRYGLTSLCGLRRDMEDAVTVRTDFLRRRCSASGNVHFFGVFDGHGCSHVAAWCKDRMHEMVAEEVEKLETVVPPAPMEYWKLVMHRSFLRMDAEVVGWRGAGGRRQNPSCRCELQRPKCDHVGSTAVVAVVTANHIVIANCGDSRAVLCRKGAAIPLSMDHKPDRPDELQRIEAAGGRVIFWDGPRVLGVLAMSRAIGDGYLKPYVTAEPDVTVTEREEDDACLILASDGLWDVVTNETACEIVRMCLRSGGPAAEGRGSDEFAARVGEGTDKACSDAASVLTKLALARRSADNVSVVVVDLRRNPC